MTEQQANPSTTRVVPLHQLEWDAKALVRTVYTDRTPVCITEHGQFLALIAPLDDETIIRAVMATGPIAEEIRRRSANPEENELATLRELRARVEEAADPNGPAYTKDSMPVSYTARRLLRGRGWPVQVAQPTAAEPFPVGTPVCMAGLHHIRGEVVEPAEDETCDRPPRADDGGLAIVLVKWCTSGHHVRWWHHPDELSLVDNEDPKEQS